MSVGKIGPFDLNKDNWGTYVDRLEQYFIANSVKSEIKVATLITVIGNDAYELMVSLCMPDKPASKTFSELVAIMRGHLNPKPSILAERFKFRQRIQKQDETIATYVSELKKMTKDCGFSADSLKENLRDQFVCGLANDDIRQKMFTEDDSITFDRAYRLAVSMEAAEANAALVEDGTRGKNGNSAPATTATPVYRVGRSVRPSRAGGGAGARGPVGQRELPGASGARGRPAPTSNGNETSNAVASNCNVCGNKHYTNYCKFREYTCKVCNRVGHLKKVCPSLKKNNFVYNLQEEYVNNVKEDSDGDSDEVIVSINSLSINQCNPIMISLNVNNRNIEMECDTGSAISCISYQMYKRMFPTIKIQPCTLVLKYYTGELVRPVGLIRPIVIYNNKRKVLDLYIIENGNTALLGRQWLAELNITVNGIQYNCNNNKCVETEFDLSKFSSRYSNVFAEGLGRFTGDPVSIHVREGARPLYMRARPLAYALREPVERTLEQLVRDDILTPVHRSDWATPIVPVVKKDGTIRICADYKLTLNKVIEVDRYPLPKVEDLLTRLHGGERFSKIDLSQAYAQFELDESRKYTVINTHKGLFMYKRLVYGLSSSPGVFQRRLEQLFADLPHVGVFLDDIIITGSNPTEHFDNLNKVFDRLSSSGLRVKKEKCTFFAKSVNYLGHVISKNGVHTCPEKVKAINNTPTPKNVSELRAFIGMVMYYGKFIKGVSTVLTPLYNLLRTGAKWVWNEECKSAFDQVKEALSSSEVLVHYSPDWPLVLTADASAAGVGAVISHLTPAGERPIAYASRTLTAAERAYAQIDREALAIIYAVRKFHQYLYGRKFTLRTDHKPLTYIFGNKTGIPVMAASRLQRWAILLSGYSYEIEYVASAKNCADALSRLSQSKTKEERPNEITYLNFVENFLPVTNDDIRESTTRDPLLSRIAFYIQSGWPAAHCLAEELRPYYTKRNELYIERGCVMWGYRVVVPITLREKILNQLHASHMGIVKTKSLARSYVWWPNIDADVETACRSCETCALEAAAPPRAAPRSWPYVAQPWSRLHIDFLGPFHTKTFLVVIDASTKWIEIFEMVKTNAGMVIKVLRALFARFGLPNEVVSDQGPPFTSQEFQEFLSSNGINQSFSPVYHPSSNGAAENAVKLCKRAIKKAMRDSVDVDAALQTYLLAYRNSIHSTTGDTPAMLLQRRPLRSRLDLLRSSSALHEQVSEAQHKQMASSGGAPVAHTAGDAVWARNYGGPDRWLKGTVVSKEGSRRYIIGSDDGRLLTRHVDQVKGRSRRSSLKFPNPPAEDRSEDDVERQPATFVSEDSCLNKATKRVSLTSVPDDDASDKTGEGSSMSEINQPPPPTPPARAQTPVKRSERIRKPPQRYGYEID